MEKNEIFTKKIKIFIQKITNHEEIAQSLPTGF